MVGEPHFFVFLDAADRMAIGEKFVLSGKSVEEWLKIKGF